MTAPNSTHSPIMMPTIESFKSDPRLVSGRSNKAAGSPVLTTAQQGIPRPVSNVRATSAQKTIGGAKYASVNVSHNISSNDATFHHANVWVTGLNGATQPQLISGSPTGPHNLLLPATGEKVSLTVQSVGKDGSLLPLSESPSTAVQL
jgi:hypothetical protein